MQLAMCLRRGWQVLECPRLPESASEVFWCEAAVNVLAEMFRCEVVCFDLVYVVYSFVYECFVVIYFHYV